MSFWAIGLSCFQGIFQGLNIMGLVSWDPDPPPPSNTHRPMPPPIQRTEEHHHSITVNAAAPAQCAKVWMGVSPFCYG